MLRLVLMSELATEECILIGNGYTSQLPLIIQRDIKSISVSYCNCTVLKLNKIVHKMNDTMKELTTFTLAILPRKWS